jgi:hypothetical protein
MANVPSEQIQPREVVPFIDMEFTSKEKKKTPEYSRDILKSVYSYFVNNKTELNWDFGDRIEELRLIGQGRQSVDYYKKYYQASGNGSDVLSDIDTYFTNDADANRGGWMNVIWDNLSPIANVKTIAKSIVNRSDFDIRANVIDIKATDEEDRRMMKHYAMAKYKDQLDFLRGKWGLPQSQNRIISDEYTDLLNIKKQGGFKAHYILGIEQLLKWTSNYSNWDDHLKERFFDDIFDTRYAFACAEYDRLNHKPKWRWIDVKDVVVQSTLTHDFSDIDYGGYFDYPTINELRAAEGMIQDGNKTLSSKDDWVQLGKSYAEFMGNPTKTELNKIEVSDTNFSGREGSIRVCRLNLYWKDYESESYVEYMTPYGRKKRRPYKNGEKVAEGDKLTNSRVEKLYYGQWIVGTDWMQSWGAMENMPRKNKREIIFPFRGVKLMEKSFTERLAPLAHTFAIAWIRLCNAISKAQNDFYLIDFNALAEIDDGGNKLKWNDIVRMMREENVFLWDSSRQAPSIGGSGAPVQKVAGTLMEDMTKELTLMNQMYAKIEQLIGIPPVALGVTPESEQAVRTTQMSVASSNSALNLLILSVMRVKKGLGEASCSMWQNAIKYSERCRLEASKVIGSDDIEGILNARSEFMELGIELDPRPSDELKQSFMRIAEIEVGRKNQGQSGIDAIQFMELQHHFESGGSFLEALYRLKYWKKQDEKRIQAEKEAAIRQQGEVLNQNARVSEEETRKTMAMQSNQSQADSQAKAQYDAQIEQQRFQNEIKKMEAEYNMQRGKAPTATISDIERKFFLEANRTS